MHPMGRQGYVLEVGEDATGFQDIEDLDAPMVVNPDGDRDRRPQPKKSGSNSSIEATLPRTRTTMPT